MIRAEVNHDLDRLGVQKGEVTPQGNHISGALGVFVSNRIAHLRFGNLSHTPWEDSTTYGYYGYDRTPSNGHNCPVGSTNGQTVRVQSP